MLSATQFQELLQCVTNTLKNTSPPGVLKDDHLHQVARSEHYISQGLTSKFDGKRETLAPWIKKFRTLRSNALWREATYLTINTKRYDILSDFTKIKETDIKPLATTRWTPENQLKSLRPEHSDLFYARILGKVVISSITDEFYTTLQNYAGDDLASDGPLLLWLILTHFHTSTITYHEGLKQQIRSRDLGRDHQHDIESYLIWLRHQVDILCSTSISSHDTHPDLLDPIFQQLMATKSNRFRRIVEDWHLEYHTEERSFTPTTLVDAADKKCKALRQSNQLYTPQDTELLALVTKLAPSNNPKNGRSSNRPPKPAWYDHPPTNPHQTHQFDNRTWYWCTKCGQRGKWVCTHTTAQHSESFVKKRPGENPASGTGRRPSPSPPPQAHAATAFDSESLAKLVATQVTNQLNNRFSHTAPPPPPTFSTAPTVHLAHSQPTSAQFAPMPPRFGQPSHLMQPMPAPTIHPHAMPGLAQIVADQVQHQLQAHFATTREVPPPPPPAPLPPQYHPTTPNDVLDW
jgi:hypothetical protein